MFAYEPLRHDNIRIVTLQPRTISPGDSLHLSMSLCDLNHASPYEALSYVWGDCTNTVPITIDAQTMRIGRNLHDALMQLRQEGTPRTFWVDAICINQQDDVEKSQQVARMVEIYANACSTTMWIGNQDALPELFWNAIQSLSNECRPSNALFRQNGNRVFCTFGDLIPQSIDLLMSQTYFTRSWITQEIAVSRTCILTCGSNRVDFDDILIAFLEVNFLQRDRTKHARRYLGLTLLRDIFHPYLERTGEDIEESENGGDEASSVENSGDEDSREIDGMPDLIKLLIEERDKGATDPRDKVYALLGISRRFGRCRMLPDYTVNVNRLYTTIARDLVQQSQNGLRILSSSQPRYSLRNLPSWVPDWSQPWRGGIDSRRSFAAAARLQPSIFTGTQHDTILLRGLQLDLIKSTRGTPFNDWKYPRGFPKSLKETFDGEAARLGFSGHYPFTSETYDVVLLQVLTAGRAGAVIEADFSRFISFSAKGDSEWNPFCPHKRRWDLVYNNLAWSEGEWDLFETEKGYLGLGPTTAEPGDIICILSGGNVPFVLRRWEGHGYRLVGELYVHGVMFGEAVVGKDVDQLEDFLIL